MSLEQPTTAEVSDGLLAQLEAKLEQTVPLLAKAFLRVLSKSVGGALVLLYRYAGFTFLQIFVATASTRETEVLGRSIIPLVEWGRLAGVGDPVAAVRAELVVRVTVELQTGSIPSGAQLLRSPTGVVYVTTHAVALDAPTVDITIRAVSDQNGGGGAGEIGNLDPGDVVSFASPLPNIRRDAVVVSQAVTGADRESWDVYRSRVLRRWQRRPQGGAYADYQQWGEEDPGVVAVYPYTGSPGEVDVYVEATAASSGNADGIPTAAQLEAVRDLIDLDENGLASRRNVNAAVNVLPITRKGYAIEVTGLDAVDEVAARAAIEAAVDEYLRSREPFIVGLSLLPRRDRITRAAVSGVVAETAEALGAAIISVKLLDDGVEIDTSTLGPGELAKSAGVTWT